MELFIKKLCYELGNCREIYFYMIYLYYDNDGLDPSEEYYRKKKKVNYDDPYYPLEESEPPHY